MVLLLSAEIPKRTDRQECNPPHSQAGGCSYSCLQGKTNPLGSGHCKKQKLALPVIPAHHTNRKFVSNSAWKLFLATDLLHAKL